MKKLRHREAKTAQPVTGRARTSTPGRSDPKLRLAFTPPSSLPPSRLHLHGGRGVVWTPGEAPPGQQWGQNGEDTRFPALRLKDLGQYPPGATWHSADGSPGKGSKEFSHTHSLDPDPLTPTWKGWTFVSSAPPSVTPLGWPPGILHISS